MSGKKAAHDKASGKKAAHDKAHHPSREHWLDEKADTPRINAYTQRLASYLEAIADGEIDEKELADQEARLVACMKAVESKLDDPLHAEVTQLLCELTAYNIMHTVQDFANARVKTRFRG